MLRHCSSGYIYISIYLLYLLNTFSVVIPTLEHTISPGELVWLEWNYFLLICYSQESRIEVRCIQFLLLLQRSKGLKFTTLIQSFLQI